MFWISERDGFFLVGVSISSFTTLEEKVVRGGMGGTAGQGHAREEGASNDEGIQGVEQTSALSKGYLAVSDLTRRDYRRKRKNAYHSSTTNRAKIESL